MTYKYPSPSNAMRMLSIVASVSLCITHNCMAEPALPSEQTLTTQKNNLLETKKALSESKLKQKNLTSSIDKIKKEYEKITGETQEIAFHLQKIERTLTTLETQLDSLTISKKEKEEILKKRGKDLSQMVSAMIRLGRAPQEAVIVMPEGIAGKIKASRALGLMSNSIHTQITAITKQMDELQTIEQRIKEQQLNLKKENVTLLERRENLTRAINEQQTLLEKLHADDLAEQQKIADLSRKSNDLQTLISTLEKEREKARIAKANAAKTLQKPKTQVLDTARNEAPLTKRNITMPAAGSITGRYGQRRGNNNTLKGIEVATRARAIITSPVTGEILFTGPFMDYGNMVIIRHSTRYMVLMAGFDTIKCRPGQNITKGSPVGIMSGQTPPSPLYLELRDHGKPTDPMLWLDKEATLVSK